MADRSSWPAPGPMDGLTGYPVMDQKYSTGLLAPYSVGWSIGLMAYGIVLNSFSRYLQSSFYSRDSKWRKALTWSVVILNTGCIIQICENSFYWSTLQTRSTVDLENYRDWGVVSPVLSGCLAILVQGIYAQRAYNLFEKAYSKAVFACFITLGMLGALAGSFMLAGLSYLSWKGKVAQALPVTFPICSGIWLWCSAFVDITNTVTLCVLLRMRVKGFGAETDGIVKAVMVLAVETASYTSVFALIGAVLSVSFHPSTDLTADFPAAFWIPLPSLYAVSLFTTMTSRDRIAGQASGSAGSVPGNTNTYNVDMSQRASVGSKTGTKFRTAGGLPGDRRSGLPGSFGVGSGEQTRTIGDEEAEVPGPGINALGVYASDD